MRALRLWVLGLTIALPALAGTGYVPFVHAFQPGDGVEGVRATRVRVLLVNLGNVPRIGNVHFVAAGQDGNSGGVALLAQRVAPGQAAETTCCDGVAGLLILSGAPQIAYEAYLEESFPQESAPNSISVRLPVITAKDALPAGSRGTLQQLSGDGAGIQVSSFGILNLGHQPAHCSADGFPPYVEVYVQQLTVAPVSVAAFPDFFYHPTLGASARPVVTCDQPFYPFALIYHDLLNSRFSSSLPWIEFAGPVVPLGTVP